MRFLSFERFKKEYKKIKSEVDRHEIFYLSLFDISFQDVEKSSEMRRIWKWIKEKIRDRIVHHFKKGIFRKVNVDDFIQRNIYNDRLCKFIIAIELEKEGLRCRFSKSEDLIVDGNKNLVIEIKRVVTGTQLVGYIKEIEKKYADSDKKVLILLLFPQFGSENVERIAKLTEIYYIVESYLEMRLKNVKVLCQYVAESKVEKYSLSKLVKRIKESIKFLEG